MAVAAACLNRRPRTPSNHNQASTHHETGRKYKQDKQEEQRSDKAEARPPHSLAAPGEFLRHALLGKSGVDPGFNLPRQRARIFATVPLIA